MNTSVMNNPFDSRDFLLVGSNFSTYTDLMIARLTDSQNHGKVQSADSFSAKVKHFFLDK